MPAEKMSRSTYTSRNVGDYPESLQVMGVSYAKVDDLRYGTNPHQTGAFYKPLGRLSVVGDMEVLKTGKGGLSQTNLEDISYALNICKFFDRPACACMKHVNPSGAAVATPDESVIDAYRKARDSDPRAAFGSVVAFNVPVHAEVAHEVMSTFVECVVAPEFSDEALRVFNDTEKYKLNSSIRILKCGDPRQIPRFVGEDVTGYRTLKVLADGCIVVADPLLTHVRGPEDLKLATAESKSAGKVSCARTATPRELEDLLVAWYININVRSNGVVIVKNGGTLSVGTGEQDRVGAVEQAVWKYQNKYKGPEKIQDSVMASDGFFPFPDAVEVAAAAGVRTMVAPAGSLKDADVIARANELGVALYHAPERVFSHH
ncbi:MAG: IMP cyclohydrolase [Lentisphaerae bacterium RIFOXYB12_FULL_65_16]|nr:MAG: IMP cyclohydrolase [Lentisphaerae bacterium RIFOXYA12_64_32]OGV89236.1 MAG: IMP cyclohydrolase [Lentisphaerae bacterium RIFOXYB12_FULL_65_16]